MMINNRLAKLEAAARVRDVRTCGCSNRMRVIWPDTPEHADKPSPGAERCGHCGGERITLKVVYASG